MKIFTILLLFCLLGEVALAAETLLEKQDDEMRAKNLFSLVRCTVCNGQSIKDSNADIAQALRKNIREQVSSGKSDDEIKEFLEVKYGEVIILTPKVDSKNIFLWLIPALLAGFGMYSIFRRLKR